eukprot:scaffold19486_cov105-Skeletonema_dohrnii-CCMP3373.AAC.1
MCLFVLQSFHTFVLTFFRSLSGGSLISSSRGDGISRQFPRLSQPGQLEGGMASLTLTHSLTHSRSLSLSIYLSSVDCFVLLIALFGHVISIDPHLVHLPNLLLISIQHLHSNNPFYTAEGSSLSHGRTMGWKFGLAEPLWKASVQNHGQGPGIVPRQKSWGFR